MLCAVARCHNQQHMLKTAEKSWLKYTTILIKNRTKCLSVVGKTKKFVNKKKEEKCPASKGIYKALNNALFRH